MTDLTGELDATERAVGRRRIAAGDARTAVIRRRYAADIADVWDACTTPERIARWFLPVSGDLRLGGTFQLAGNAGGSILRCEPPHRLTLSWAYADRPIDEVELRLTPADDGDTLLEIEHASTAIADLWGVGMGWELPLVYSLPRHLRGDLPADAAARWAAMPPEVEALIAKCTQTWQAVAAALGSAPA